MKDSCWLQRKKTNNNNSKKKKNKQKIDSENDLVSIFIMTMN